MSDAFAPVVFPLGAATGSRAAAPCAHCRLPSNAVEGSSEPAFCCEGCRSVYGILNASGLEGFYRYREARGAAPARPSHRRYQEFDEPSFREQYCRPGGHGATRVELLLEGVHCSACVWLVERVSRLVPGVSSARLDLSRSVVEVEFHADQVQLSEVARGFDRLGYPPHAASAGTAIAEQRAGDRALLLRMGVAGAAAGNVMLMAFALYSGGYSGMSPEYVQLFRWGSLLIATPTVFWAGAVFFRSGWAALRTRTPHMDLPISIGILCGYAGGAVNTLRSSGEVYFDSLCTLIFLLLVGRHLQRTHHRRATRASEMLESLAPATARLVERGETRDVPAHSVAAGALVEVAPGERIPVDGTVERGRSVVDAALLTGEPVPEDVTTGDRVHAGTVNAGAPLLIRVESAGATTRLGKLLEAVAVTQRERAPIVRLADRVAGYFVVAILVIAAATLGWWLLRDPAHAVDHTIALLVVTCPCALGMATPLAITAALRRAAKAGVMFKSGEHVEELARRALIVLDKTGTLTEARLELAAFEGPDFVKPLLRAAESRSHHPIARAVQRAFAEELTVDCEEALVAAHAERGYTPVVVAVDEAARAVAAFADQLRPDSRASLQSLASLGYGLAIVSGDHQRVVDAAAAELGVRFEVARGGATPEQKLELVRTWRASGRRVVMVGDGINDAAAMSAANVGVAVHGGAEACLSSADVFTTRSGLSRVVVAVEGARRTVGVIRRGILFSLLYNAVGVALAVSGALSPLLAAILMPLSSITVVTVAIRSRTFPREAAS